MTLVDFLAALVLLLAFIGGLKDGAVKGGFSLVSFIIALPITGAAYRTLAGMLSFLPGSDLENVAGFFITLAIVVLIMNLVFLVPRKIVQTIWGSGCLFRVLGGALGVLNAAIGLAVLTLVVLTYPVFDWVARAVAGSAVPGWLVANLGFVKALLPAEFWGAPGGAAFMLMMVL